jgi:SAM-dependent methyltransferase
MASTAVPERIRWAVETLDPGPDDHLLEIGCGPGLAITPICERLVGGRIVAIDRSATAISRAERRNAEHVAAGRAVLRTAALEALDPSEALAGRQRFDKVFAMNVNLFWTRPAARELDRIRGLLGNEGALYLFYGYGGAAPPATDSQNPSRVLDPLTQHLAERGFGTQVGHGGGVVCVVARTTPSEPLPAWT